MSRIIQSLSLAALLVTIIPLRAFSSPILTAQRQSPQAKPTPQKSFNSVPSKGATAQPKATKSTTSTLQNGQDKKVLPPVDAEFGLKATFGKCSAVEIIGPDGTCIPTPIPAD